MLTMNPDRYYGASLTCQSRATSTCEKEGAREEGEESERRSARQKVCVYVARVYFTIQETHVSGAVGLKEEGG